MLGCEVFSAELPVEGSEHVACGKSAAAGFHADERKEDSVRPGFLESHRCPGTQSLVQAAAQLIHPLGTLRFRRDLILDLTP